MSVKERNSLRALKLEEPIRGYTPRCSYCREDAPYRAEFAFLWIFKPETMAPVYRTRSKPMCERHAKAYAGRHRLKMPMVESTPLTVNHGPDTGC